MGNKHPRAKASQSSDLDPRDALLRACDNKAVDLALELIASGEYDLDRTMSNTNNTALTLAIVKQLPGTVAHALIDNGADVHKAGQRGFTPLMLLACRHSSSK